MKGIKTIIDLFRIRVEERWMALVHFLIIASLNVLVIRKYFDSFSRLVDNYRGMLSHVFCISGFDPFSYDVVSQWHPGYNIYRHPLLAFFMYLPYQVNQGLMSLTGVDCAQFVVAAILIFCAFYSLIFLFRIFREVIEISYWDAIVLSFMLFSFAYIMLAACVPDHFIMSMFMLLLVLYLSGLKMKRHLSLTRIQTIVLFFITAGVSLNNGIKVIFANFWVNGKAFFKPLNLLQVVILPSALIWGVACLEWKHFEAPKVQAQTMEKEKKNTEAVMAIYAAFRDTSSITDSAQIAVAVKKIIREKAREKYIRDHRQPWNMHSGKPMAHGQFTQWTDVSTPRWASVVENLFGESIQLHPDYLLQDTFRSRPVIVEYRWIINYVVEGGLVLGFLFGIWYGRRSKFLWMALSFFGFDMLIHIVLGFGLNEVYIMGAHWLFVLPLSMGYLVKQLKGKGLLQLRLLLTLLTVFLYLYNGILITRHLLA